MWEPDKDMDRILDAVESAPSIFNSKPWLLDPVAKDRIELHAKQVAGDGEAGENPYWLRVDERGFYVDPLARELAISCGAALYNLRLAIRVMGHDLTVRLPPYREPESTLLAVVEIVTGRIMKPTLEEQELYEAIWRRHTNRWPYRIIPAPLAIIVAMEDAAAEEGAWLRLLHKRQARKWMRVVAGADADLAAEHSYLSDIQQERYRRYREERELLISGVPPAGYGPLPESRLPRPLPRTRKDFWLVNRKRRFEHRPQLMALSTEDDQLLDWLRAGQALQRAILTGTRYSASAPYGLAAKYHAPRRYGVPGRHYLRNLMTRHYNLAYYGLSVSFLTQPLECYDIEHPLRRADEELERPGGEHERISEPRRSPWRTVEPRHWPLRMRWRYPELPQMVLRVGYAGDREDDDDTAGSQREGAWREAEH